MTLSGHCLCGATTWTAGPMRWACYCHCESCRRAHGAPVSAVFGVARDGFAWTGAAPGARASSPGVRRLFCAECGTPMAYDGDWDRRCIHLFAPTLTDPAAFVPEFHVHFAERLPWFPIADALPKYDKFKS